VRLSRESRYAIEALVVFAGRPPQEQVDARAIATEAGLPLPYLQKILRQLAVGGILTSQRGHGYVLARAPDRITIADVLDIVEGGVALDARCIFWREDCSNDNPCELHFRWRELRPQILRTLTETTIADVREANAPIATK
jgi:Rrf2 family protein